MLLVRHQRERGPTDPKRTRPTLCHSRLRPPACTNPHRFEVVAAARAPLAEAPRTHDPTGSVEEDPRQHVTCNCLAPPRAALRHWIDLTFSCCGSSSHHPHPLAAGPPTRPGRRMERPPKPRAWLASPARSLRPPSPAILPQTTVPIVHIKPFKLIHRRLHFSRACSRVPAGGPMRKKSARADGFRWCDFNAKMSAIRLMSEDQPHSVQCRYYR